MWHHVNVECGVEHSAVSELEAQISSLGLGLLPFAFELGWETSHGCFTFVYHRIKEYNFIMMNIISKTTFYLIVLRSIKTQVV